MTNFHSFAGIFCPWSGTSHEILVCSNVEGNIRGLRQIPSNLQVNYHLADGNWAEGSTELAPIIEFLTQGSIKPEPRWLWYISPRLVHILAQG